MQPNPAVPKICELFTEAAQTHAIGTVDPRILDVARISCINDIQTTLDLQVERDDLYSSTRVSCLPTDSRRPFRPLVQHSLL